MRTQTQLAGESFDLEDWPSYRRPAGRIWQMNPSRRVIYENKEADAQADWKAELILEMMHRNRIVPQDICEVGVGGSS